MAASSPDAYELKKADLENSADAYFNAGVEPVEVSLARDDLEKAKAELPKLQTHAQAIFEKTALTKALGNLHVHGVERADYSSAFQAYEQSLPNRETAETELDTRAREEAMKGIVNTHLVRLREKRATMDGADPRAAALDTDILAEQNRPFLSPTVVELQAKLAAWAGSPDRTHVLAWLKRHQAQAEVTKKDAEIAAKRGEITALESQLRVYEPADPSYAAVGGAYRGLPVFKDCNQTIRGYTGADFDEAGQRKLRDRPDKPFPALLWKDPQSPLPGFEDLFNLKPDQLIAMADRAQAKFDAVQTKTNFADWARAFGVRPVNVKYEGGWGKSHTVYDLDGEGFQEGGKYSEEKINRAKNFEKTFAAWRPVAQELLTRKIALLRSADVRNLVENYQEFDATTVTYKGKAEKQQEKQAADAALGQLQAEKRTQETLLARLQDQATLAAAAGAGIDSVRQVEILVRQIQDLVDSNNLVKDGLKDGDPSKHWKKDTSGGVALRPINLPVAKTDAEFGAIKSTDAVFDYFGDLVPLLLVDSNPELPRAVEALKGVVDELVRQIQHRVDEKARTFAEKNNEVEVKRKATIDAATAKARQHLLGKIDAANATIAAHAGMLDPAIYKTEIGAAIVRFETAHINRLLNIAQELGDRLVSLNDAEAKKAELDGLLGELKVFSADVIAHIPTNRLEGDTAAHADDWETVADEAAVIATHTISAGVKKKVLDLNKAQHTVGTIDDESDVKTFLEDALIDLGYEVEDAGAVLNEAKATATNSKDEFTNAVNDLRDGLEPLTSVLDKAEKRQKKAEEDLGKQQAELTELKGRVRKERGTLLERIQEIEALTGVARKGAEVELKSKKERVKKLRPGPDQDPLITTTAEQIATTQKRIKRLEDEIRRMNTLRDYIHGHTHGIEQGIVKLRIRNEKPLKTFVDEMAAQTNVTEPIAQAVVAAGIGDKAALLALDVDRDKRKAAIAEKLKPFALYAALDSNTIRLEADTLEKAATKLAEYADTP